jgi:glycosyltransferase involved in cell wall biosynthesis
MKKNVLFITYFFPPGASSGVFRPLKFVKYMDRGTRWNPIVLTIKPPYYANLDETLMKDVPPHLDIYRVDSLQPVADSRDDYKKIYHQIHLPDSAVGGLMHFVLRGLEIINSHPIDLIFCTIPHPTMALVGMMLKQITGIPLIVDYRDGWTTNPIFKPRSVEGAQLNRYFEQAVLQAADGVVVVAERLKQDLLDLGCRAEIEVIPNGLDPEDFEQPGTYPFQRRSEDEQIISYCGYVYREYMPILVRIAEAVETWNREGRKPRIRFVLAGDFQQPPDLQKLTGFPDFQYDGRLDYADAIRFVASSDASVGLVTISYSVIGKFYNLMLANQYIFAFVHSDNVQIRQVLGDYEGKQFLPLEATREEILQSMAHWINHRGQGSSTPCMQPAKLNAFTRERQARQLEAFMNRTLEDIRQGKGKSIADAIQ